MRSAAATTLNWNRAVTSYQAMQRHFAVGAGPLFRNTAASPDRHFGHLWPYSTVMAATTFTASMPGAPIALAQLADRRRGLSLYRRAALAGPPGANRGMTAFESAVVPPIGRGGDTYFDDNAWVALDLLHQYNLTGTPCCLRTAAELFDFLVTGWSSDPTVAHPGGVRWAATPWSHTRHVCSTAPTAQVGLQLHRLTGDERYLDWARRLYEWVTTALRDRGGLYFDHITSDGSIERTQWSYNQGAMIGAGVVLSALTGVQRYLEDAVQTAEAAVVHYARDDNLAKQGPAFNAIFFRNLLFLPSLSAERGDRGVIELAESYAASCWERERDPHTGLFVPPTFALIDTAAMIVIYALLGGSVPYA
jgi:hypothetical protein